MKNQTHSRLSAVLIFATVTLITLAPGAAQAREHSGRFTGSRNGTIDREVTRTSGKVDQSTTYTSPSGKVSTRDATRSKDATTGTITGSSSTNLASGKTAGSSFSSEKTD